MRNSEREKREKIERKNGKVRTDPEDENGENARRSEGKKTRGHPNNKLTYATIIYDPVKNEMVSSAQKRRKKPKREKNLTASHDPRPPPAALFPHLRKRETAANRTQYIPTVFMRDKEKKTKEKY